MQNEWILIFVIALLLGTVLTVGGVNRNATNTLKITHAVDNKRVMSEIQKEGEGKGCEENPNSPIIPNQY